MKITKAFVDKIVPPNKGQTFYRDSELKGFGVRATASGSRSFVLEKRINGKVKRLTIGRYPEITVEQARKEAQKLLGKIATGINPQAEKRAAKLKGVTLLEVFEDYLKARKNLKPLTIKDYRRSMLESFDDWHTKPLIDITRDMVAKRHSKLGERSEARANLAMRLLRAIFNFAAGEYEDERGKQFILENPVKRLSHTRAWYRVNRRQTIIKKHELPRWYQGVTNIEIERSSSKADTIRDYLLLLLFTGLRRTEAAKLMWDDVDFKSKTITLTDTKNHEQHVLPLSDFLYDMLAKRNVQAESLYVFPGTGVAGYIIEPRKVMAKIVEQSGVGFTLHDLRRTFITIAESLDIPAYALKRLLNHKNKADVTAGYLVIDVERLRKPMQLITDHLLVLMNVKEPAKILNLSDHSTKDKTKPKT